MTKRFTSGRVPASGMESLFETPARWQCWLDVEAALALSQADLGLIPEAAGAAIADACRVELLDADLVEAEMQRTSHPLMALVVELGETVGGAHGGWVHWGSPPRTSHRPATHCCCGGPTP